MVHRLTSADALPFDILPLVFKWLSSTTHLSAVALTSRTWYQAAVARLYSKIVFGLQQAKSFGRIMSQFEVISQKLELAVHVKIITIQTPMLLAIQGSRFITAVCTTIYAAKNLTSLTCTVPDLLPNVIQSLIVNKQRLEELKIFAGISMSGADRLLYIASRTTAEPPTVATTKIVHVGKGPKLKVLSLESPTRFVLSIIPTWVESLQDNLQSLTITNSLDLAPAFLDSIVSQLPLIKSLAIQNCSFITHADILRITKHHHTTLESLALTIHSAANENVDLSWPKLVSLRHLTIHVSRHGMDSSAYEATVRAVLSVTSHSALESITMRNTSLKGTGDEAGDSNSGKALGTSVVEWLVRVHKGTLKKFNVVKFKMSKEMAEKICEECKELRQLAFSVLFQSSVLCKILAHSPKLATLIDTQTALGHGGDNLNLTSRDVTRIFLQNRMSLRSIITSGRTWTSEWHPPSAETHIRESIGKEKKIVKSVEGGGKLVVTFQRRRDPFIYNVE